MYKKIYLKSLLLLAMLLSGAGSTWAQDVTYNIADASWQVSGGALTNGEISFVGEGTENFKKNNGYFMMGKKGAYINFPTYESAVEKIVVTGNSGASTAVKMNVFVGDVAVSEETTGITGTNTYEIDSDYQEAGTTYTLKVTSGHNAQITKIEVYFATGATPTCATPTFNPEAGEVKSGTKVSINCSTTGATIYYTTNGTTPTVNSNVYSNPIEITEETTIKAYAVKANHEDSEVATAVYTIKEVAEVSGYSIDFESDIEAYVDWTFENVGNTNTAIAAHGGNKYGANINENGNGTNTLSIQTKDKIALPGNLTCYVSKVSSNVTASSWTISVSSDGSTWIEVASQAAHSMNKGDWVEFTADLSSYSDVYVKISYGSSNAIRAIDDIELTMREDTGKANPELSFDVTAVEVNLGEEFNAPLNNPHDLSVTYSSSDESVATVDNSGSVSILAAGTTTITASFAGNDEYNEGSASYTLTVVDPNAPGTENNPYTVAQAIEYINTLGSSTSPNEVYVSGIISQVDSYNSNYKSITYWISDDGTTSNQMEVYGGKGMNNADFASVDDLQVGDIVIVKGYVKTYNGTPEFDKNNQLVSHSRPTNTDPVITLTPSTINVDAEEHNGTIAISLENLTVEDKAEFGVQYYNGNEPVEEIDWITVEVAEQDPQVGEGFVVSYTVAANEGPDRTATFKVYVEGGEDDVWSNPVTITQAAAPGIVDNYELFTGDLVEGDYLIVYDGKAMNTTVTNDRLQYTEVTPTDDVITTDNAAIVWHIAKSGEYWTIYNADEDAYAASTGAKNKAQMLADGTNDKALWTVSGTETYEFVNKQNAANSVNANLRNNGTYGFACYATGTGGALSLYKKVEATPEYVTVSISSAGLATFCSENALDFTGIEEVYAYKVSVNEKQISYTRVYQVPAETGVVLRSLSGDAISVEVPVIESADEIADNALVAVLEAIESLPTDGDGCTNYILNNLPSKGVGFYKANNQPVGAGKAYLQVEGTLSKDFIGFADGVATGIETIDNGWAVGNEIYDLQGRKVMNPTKGIFIQNGRKVVIK